MSRSNAWPCDDHDGSSAVKLLRYGPPGHERPEIVDAVGIVRDLSRHITDIDGDTFAPETLDRFARLDPSQLPAPPQGRLGPCLARVGKIVGVGLNYRSHALCDD